MKSKEFIREGASQGEIYEIIHAIKRDCQPYLQQAEPFDADSNLMRGMGSAKKNFIDNKSIRLDERTPKDIPKELHDKINQYFNQKFGGSFRNALFATGDYIQAKNYGNVYYIFPIGDFNFLYNPNIEDLFMNYDEYRPWVHPDKDTRTPEEQQAQVQAAIEEFFNEEIVDGQWDNTSIKAAIDSGMEVMIRAKRGYHAVSLEAIENAPSEFFRMLKL